MQPMGVYVASTGEAQMLPRCVMPAGQAIAQLNCVDWIVKAIHLFMEIGQMSMAMHCMSHCFGQLPSKMMQLIHHA